MGFQTIFKRYELKYMINPYQKELILQAMQPFMEPDRYGRSTIRNLYFDNDSYQLIRRSMEKPEYKEKLRVRCYDTATDDSTVFVELKKKYKKVVYKRRLLLPHTKAMDWLCDCQPCPKTGQIPNEIEYFMSYYKGLHPTVFLSYEREAYYDKNNHDFRITFDDNILCRCHDLSLASPPSGVPILPSDKIMMEVKCVGGLPFWLVEVLSKEKIYKTSFSKYGTAYANIIFPKLREDYSHE